MLLSYILISTIIKVSSPSHLVERNDAWNNMHTSHLASENIMISSEYEQSIDDLIFHPSILDFKEIPVGDSDSDVVTLFNKHSNKSVYLGSISGSLPDFYSSFFEEKLIPPLGNTTFNVVFLPRQQGIVQTNLLIHTSFGAINYIAKGKGIECPYRLNPLVGLRAPLNATLTPEIYMYNPHDKPLQIIEVYSSGGQFQLELPSGGPEGPKALWEIPPYCTKPIIRVRFTGTTPGNHTAYIRIKVSTGTGSTIHDAILVVPIEVEILPRYGLYSNISFLNFGFAGNADKAKKIVFKILSYGKNLTENQHESQTFRVEVENGISSGIALGIDTITDNSNTYKKITATVNWSKVKSGRFVKGNILIRSKNEENLIFKIPYVGEILKGSISYNETTTKFLTPTKTTKTLRDFILKNNFELSLAITNISFLDDGLKYFRILGFQQKILKPGEEKKIFQISQLIAAAKQPITKILLLQTNVSCYEIQLETYNGLLKRVLPIFEKFKHEMTNTGGDNVVINAGTLPLATPAETLIAFVNENPVPVVIQNWKGTVSSVASIVIILRGCSKENTTDLKFCYVVQSGDWIVFQLSVHSDSMGMYSGEFSIKTALEELITPILFNTVIGNLKLFTNLVNSATCFPVSITYLLPSFI